jgi:glycosyltransferase involved in cell wall biosynthesis
VRRLPSLSVVMPVYEEPVAVAGTLAAAVEALARSPFDDAEVVIVDDGSGTATQEALAALAAPVPLRVLRQENQGRFGARRTGIEAARGDLVLLLDARVQLEPDALAYVAGSVAEAGDGPLPAWNGHVEIDVDGNPYARFWRTVTDVAWRGYFDDPRPVRFGLDDYDRYPKGTGCFLAPRSALVAALHGFTTHFADLRDANDDTILLRPIAASQGINLAPGFACRYRSRTSLRPFLRHAHHRGKHFFDGFARRGTRYLYVVVAFFPASLALAVLALRRPRAGLALAAAAPAAAALGAVALRRPARDVAAFAALAPPFALAFGSGLWRGLYLAARHRLLEPSA